MKPMVCGFMFSLRRDYVVLIEKLKGPVAVKYRWNGVGGKVEADESSVQAMVREFQEETGVHTGVDDWELFCDCFGHDWHVSFYRAFHDSYSLAETKESERIVIVPMRTIQNCNTVPNLSWLIPLAFSDYLEFPVIVRDNS